MHISQFKPDIDPAMLEDGEVIGVDGDFVAHFNAETGDVYVDGISVQSWLDGDAETWLMTEAEALRLGVVDHGSYVALLASLELPSRAIASAVRAGATFDFEEGGGWHWHHKGDIFLANGPCESQEEAAREFLEANSPEIGKGFEAPSTLKF